MPKFGRKKAHREMMLRNLVTSLIIFEHLQTTQTKAKATKKLVDKVINWGKKNTLASHRRLLGYLTHQNAVKKIREDLINRYQDRTSGYTKSYYLPTRAGDGSKMMLLKLIPAKKTEKEKAQKPTITNQKDSSAIKVKKEKKKI